MNMQHSAALMLVLCGLMASACATGSGSAPYPQTSPTPAEAAVPLTASSSQFEVVATRTPEPQLRAPVIAEFAADTTYKDPDGFFSIKYPSKWVAKKSGSEMQFLLDKSGEVGAAITLRIKTISAAALADEIGTLLKDRRSGYKETSRKTLRVAGAEVVWVDHTYTSGGTAHRGFYATSSRNRVGFLLLGWAPKAQHSKYESAFRAMSDSLRRMDFDEAPLYEEWLTHETEHFTFYYLPDTNAAEAIDDIAEEHEAVYGDIVQTLKVNYDEMIHFYLYPSREALYRSTARESGHAITDASEVHSLWISEDERQSTGHEMTHIITAQAVGEPSEALLGEGIAVCLDHSGNKPHVVAARLLKAKRHIVLEDMLGDAWFEKDAEVAYAQSGSFACYLLEKNGAKKFKQIYVEADFISALKHIYGANLSALEKKWLEMLRAVR